MDGILYVFGHMVVYVLGFSGCKDSDKGVKVSVSVMLFIVNWV